MIAVWPSLQNLTQNHYHAKYALFDTPNACKVFLQVQIHAVTAPWTLYSLAIAIPLLLKPDHPAIAPPAA